MRPGPAVTTGCLVAALWLAGSARPAGQPAPATALLDDLLDLYVRDGMVYYAALKSDRGKLDRFLQAIAAPGALDWASRPQQLAFWINAYNAFVLETVIGHYPIAGRASSYPRSSVRQVPGAFDRRRHRAAGREVTLDEIEELILPAFHDPRAYLALGRGAVGSGRLLSEAYTPDRLEDQLERVRREFVERAELFRIDPVGKEIGLSPIVGWHEAEFVEAYEPVQAGFPDRSPIERAILAFVEPYLLPGERAFVAKNEFRVRYLEFDWTLNDLSGRR